MSLETDAPTEVMWEGKYVRAIKRGKWEYASRSNNIGAVAIVAEVDGKIILVEQPRVATGKRCLELPAGLVGDEDDDGVEQTALKELQQETGYTAETIERISDFYASPGMLSESFTLVRATGLTKVGEGGGDENEDINVHLVPRDEVRDFIFRKRDEGLGLDVKLLLFLNA